MAQCIVTIVNSSPNPMTLTQYGEEHGDWGGASPPGSIPKSGSVDFNLYSASGYGPNGYATYEVKDSAGLTAKIKFFFSDPISGTNVVDWVWDPYPDKHPAVTATYKTQTGGDDAAWRDNSVDPDDSPVRVIYTVTGQ
jgi:hypothetical protein